MPCVQIKISNSSTVASSIHPTGCRICGKANDLPLTSGGNVGSKDSNPPLYLLRRECDSASRILRSICWWRGDGGGIKRRRLSWSQQVELRFLIPDAPAEHHIYVLRRIQRERISIPNGPWYPPQKVVVVSMWLWSMLPILDTATWSPGSSYLVLLLKFMGIFSREVYDGGGFPFRRPMVSPPKIQGRVDVRFDSGHF